MVTIHPQSAVVFTYAWVLATPGYQKPWYWLCKIKVFHWEWTIAVLGGLRYRREQSQAITIHGSHLLAVYNKQNCMENDTYLLR